MYGWEFPPRMSGGLGTACYGMTKALAGLGNEILFVVPGLEMIDANPSIRLIAAGETPSAMASSSLAPFESILVRMVHSPLRPYMNARQYSELTDGQGRDRCGSYLAAPAIYGEDLMAEVLRYSQAAAEIAARERFDVIHGHDWMTVAAGLAAKKESGKPFVLHIHALEFDRSGENIDRGIYDIERCGMEMADAVIAVSHYTKNLIVERYGILPEKISVVHNAVARRDRCISGSTERVPGKTVLFLGRITYQKGPDYFIEAARKVLTEMPDVTFVMAGVGDLMPRMIEKVAELGLGKRFHFTGFLQDAEVEGIFAKSDLYVMPSISEPFGISPLEAMQHDVPVIISKQSGVAEILRHVLTVDFWDVDELANKMIAVLKYPPLVGEIVEKAKEELRTILWEAAAVKIEAVYEKTVTVKA